MRRSMVRAVATMRLVLLMLLLFLVFLFVTQHVRTDCASDKTADSTEGATTKFIPQECAASTSDEG